MLWFYMPVTCWTTCPGLGRPHRCRVGFSSWRVWWTLSSRRCLCFLTSHPFQSTLFHPLRCTSVYSTRLIVCAWCGVSFLLVSILLILLWLRWVMFRFVGFRSFRCFSLLFCSFRYWDSQLWDSCYGWMFGPVFFYLSVVFKGRVSRLFGSRVCSWVTLCQIISVWPFSESLFFHTFPW